MSFKLGLSSKIRRSRASGGFVPLLDESFATGATAAYSLRKLKSSASKAVRVREDSGNTETDVGFSGSTLDTTALLNHCGSANGFVTIWYDQSGNGNDASNATAAEQPKIYDASSGLITENGKAAIQFDGSTNVLSLSKSGVYDADVFTLTMVYRTLSTQASQRIYDARGLGGTTDDVGHTLRFYNSASFLFSDLSEAMNCNSNSSLNQEIRNILWNADSNNSTSELRTEVNNNGLINPSLTGVGTVSNNPASVYIDVKGGDVVTIGASNESTDQYFHGNLQEMIFIPNKEVTKMNDELNSFYSIY
jgi:hypothetical protein